MTLRRVESLMNWTCRGLRDGFEGEWKQLLTKWEHPFAHSDLDLGKMSLIKHHIELTERMSFKECYQWIPLHMYDDVKVHLQEMLEIGAIWKAYNPCASAVVLVQMKDGSLRFCTDLRNLNNWTIKDATHYIKLMRPSTAHRGPNGSPHLTWILSIGSFEMD